MAKLTSQRFLLSSGTCEKLQTADVAGNAFAVMITSAAVTMVFVLSWPHYRVREFILLRDLEWCHLV